MNIKIATTLRLSNQFILINKERIIDCRFKTNNNIDNSNYYKKIFQLLDDYDKIKYQDLIKEITNSVDYYKNDKPLTEEALKKAINDMIYNGYDYRSFNPYEYL